MTSYLDIKSFFDNFSSSFREDIFDEQVKKLNDDIKEADDLIKKLDVILNNPKLLGFLSDEEVDNLLKIMENL
jgi:hypothetical protein